MEHYLETTFTGTQFHDLSGDVAMGLIQNIMGSVNKFCDNREEVLDVLIANYVREVWIAESPPPSHVDTVVVSDLLTEGKARPDNIDMKTWAKLRNVHAALSAVVLNNSSNETGFYGSFDLDFVKSVHALVGENGVFSDGGQFRTKMVIARSSNVIYARPYVIEEHLTALLAFVRKNAVSSLDGLHRIEHMIKLGSLFFSEFLLIHPFANGNGRTARILLNAMLRYSVIIPFSLYVKSRDEYLSVLEKRNNRSSPSALATYILYAVNQTAAQINWLTM